MSEKLSNTVIVSARIPPHLRERVRDLAKKNGRTFNAELIHALEIYAVLIAEKFDAPDAELLDAAFSTIRELHDLIQQLHHQLRLKK